MTSWGCSPLNSNFFGIKNHYSVIRAYKNHYSVIRGHFLDLKVLEKSLFHKI